MNTRKPYSHKELRYINYIYHHTNDMELKIKLSKYRWNLKVLKIVADNLRKPKPVVFTKTIGVSRDPDLFI